MLKNNDQDKTDNIEKIATGIKGLDEILHGGIPMNRTTIVTGGPGTGKTILGMEFLFKSALNGNPGVFLSFEEQSQDLKTNFRTLGWDLEELENKGDLSILTPNLSHSVVISDEFSIEGLLSMLEALIDKTGARLMCIDAVDVLLRHLDNPIQEESEIQKLHNWLLDHKITSIITMKSISGEIAPRYGFINFLVDCVVHMKRISYDRVTALKLEVIKYRGSKFRRSLYPVVIKKGGIKLIPISHAAGIEDPEPGEIISCGLSRLDFILGGGYRSGSCILISGPTGTGKTTLAGTFVKSAWERNEKTLYINFEETTKMMLAFAKNVGIDLYPALKEDKLHIMACMPELKLAEEHLVDTFETIAEFAPDHLIIDAISACHRMGNTQTTFDYLVSIISACKQKGITCILINQSSTADIFSGITGMEVSSLVDTIIMVRYIESEGELNRMLMVIKSRGFNHSNQYREFNITGSGIDILDVYDGEGSVLTGVARKDQEARELLLHKQRNQSIKIQKQKINQIRAALEANTAKYLAEIQTSTVMLETLQEEADMWEKNRAQRSLLRKTGEESLEKK